MRWAKSVLNAHFGRIGNVHLSHPPDFLMAIATYREDQWDRLRASAADRDSMDETWEKWNAGIEEVIASLELRPCLRLCSAGRGRN